MGTDFRFWTDGRFSNPENLLIRKYRQRTNMSGLTNHHCIDLCTQLMKPFQNDAQFNDLGICATMGHSCFTNTSCSLTFYYTQVYCRSSDFTITTLSSLQIWNHNVIRDQYLGKHVFMNSNECKDTVESVDLVGRGKNNEKLPGKLYVQITQSRTLTSI